MERYYSFNRFLMERLGCRVYKVCVDAGFNCPNRDGTLSLSGCSFCNNDSFGPGRRLAGQSLEKQIEAGIQKQRARTRVDSYLVYFQSFTNTYAPADRLKELYSRALGCEGVIGLCIATRPDCLEDEVLECLQALAERHFILLELGLQSSHDRTLRAIHRGHDYGCFEQAVRKCQERQLAVSAHIILGLPGETEEMMLTTADRLAALPLDCLKIHDLHIVKETALARSYLRDPFPLLSRQEYIHLLCRFLERLPSRIAIERLFSSTPSSHLLAPDWAVNPGRLLEDIRRELENQDTWQGRLLEEK